MQGSSCSHWPDEAPECDALGSSVSLCLQGWCCSSISTSPSPPTPRLSFKEVVAVHLKRAILLLNLALKIPGGAAHGLYTPQAGGCFTCVFITGLEREVI